MQSHRLGAVRVTGELMRCVFFTPSADNRGWFRVAKGLPADAEYRRMYHDQARDEFVFVFAHDSFLLTPPGCEVPTLDAPLLEAWTNPALAAEFHRGQRADADADAPHVVGG